MSKQDFIKIITSIPGIHFKQKIMIFESDDWGSIRMLSKDIFDFFLDKGFKVYDCPYNRYDALESNSDLENLFEVLSSIKDKNHNPVIFTLNSLVANPDFDKIRKSNFENYYFEPITATLKRYPNRENVLNLYKEGIALKLIKPQFHGREHINVNRWMEKLNARDTAVWEAFQHNMFTVHIDGMINSRRDNLDAFGLGYQKKWVSEEEIVRTGIALFESIFGFKPKSFIAPAYVWHPDLEVVLKKHGIKYLQGTHVQRIPNKKNKIAKISKQYHYTGQRNKIGQYYLVRNVYFEPSLNQGNDIIDKTLYQINLAFKLKKPAIISSHRVNYIGAIDPKNRDRNLLLLKDLLRKIIKKWPDVEFLSSDQLGDIIAGRM